VGVGLFCRRKIQDRTQTDGKPNAKITHLSHATDDVAWRNCTSQGALVANQIYVKDDFFYFLVKCPRPKRENNLLDHHFECCLQFDLFLKLCIDDFSPFPFFPKNRHWENCSRLANARRAGRKEWKTKNVFKIFRARQHSPIIVHSNNKISSLTRYSRYRLLEPKVNQRSEHSRRTHRKM
jgi:hypothetical protein